MEEEYEDVVSKIERDETAEVKKASDANDLPEDDELDYTDLATEGTDANLNEADLGSPLDELQKIQKWLDRIESFSTIRNVNFMSQFSVSENFIIDGESLVKQMFENPQLDWNFGGQFAHLIWLVENFLWNLQHRGGRFKVVFFSNYENFFQNSKKLARKLIISHLLKNQETSKIEVFVFNNWWNSPEWEQFLEETQPSFFFTKMDFKEETDIQVAKLSSIIRSMGFYYSNTYVLLLDDVSYQGARIFAFCKEPFFRPDRVADARSRIIAAIPKIMEGSVSDSNNINMKIPPVLIEHLNNSRELVSLSALNALLSTSGHLNREQVAVMSWYFCLFLDVIKKLPLQNRSHSIPDTADESEKQFISKLAGKMWEVIECNPDVLAKLEDNSWDLFDGRLFHNVMRLAALEPDCKPSLWKFLVELHPDISKMVSKTNMGEVKKAEEYVSLLKALGEKASNYSKFPLHKLNNNFIQNLMPEVLEKFRPYEHQEVISGGWEADYKYQPNHHWKSGRDFKDPSPFEIANEENPIKKKWKLKGLQKQEAAMKKFIDSLLVDSPVKPLLIVGDETKQERQEKTKIAKKSLEPEEVSDDNSKKEVETSLTPEGRPKKPPKEKKVVVKKIDKMRQDNLKKKSNEQELKMKDKFTNLTKDLNITKNKAQIASIEKSIEDFANDCRKQELYDLCITAHLFLIDFLGGCFAQESEALAPKIYVKLQNILRSVDLDKFPPKQLEKVASLCARLGFADMAQSINPNFKSKGKENKSAIAFQLHEVSYHLRKPEGKVEDPRKRVPFKPDDWQLQLLNIVDAGESALICAPTSSGKTFICYYAMESVLRIDSTSVVVYVAPTKALVNQVEAEVSARFSKNYTNGNSVVGVFTRDYRKNIRNCQILVTVPSCLEILLTHGVEDPFWDHRLKYVIFDEVHSIGSEEGDVWERLLLLIECPFLALSATIGNFQELYLWLASVEKSRGRTLYPIVYSQRYNDLVPYVFKHPGVSETESTGEIIELNTGFAVDPKYLAKYERFQRDFKLLPRHLMQIYEGLSEGMKNLPADLGSELRSLNPEKFFTYLKEKMHYDISMIDCTNFEEKFKNTILKMTSAAPAPLGKLIEKLDSNSNVMFGPIEEELSTKDPHVYYDRHIVELVRTLEKEEKLPAILFHFDRVNCVKLTKRINSQLEREEEAYKQKNKIPEKLKAIEKEIADLEKWKDKLESKQMQETSKVTKDFKLSPGEKAQLEKLESLKMQRDACTRILPEFSFVSKTSAEDEEIAALLKVDVNEIDDNELYKALRRGIGCHHAGLPKYYRQAVERLFRMKRLKVVIATGTLAMGVNMPCKAVVFLGSSHHLNAMNYRQMQGRAGRRGFDDEGYVIFYGMSKSRVKALINSNLPDLVGHIPMSPTIALRMISKYMAWSYDDLKIDQRVLEKILEADRERTIEATRRLLKFPFFGVERSNYLADQMSNYMRLSFDFLSAEGYLDSDGVPQQFCGLILHLFYLEPSNFVFVAFLKSGLFEQICSSSKDTKQVGLKLLPILARLFCREKLYMKSVTPSALRGPSKIVLPNLPEEFHEVLKDYNERTLRVFGNFMRCAGIVHEKEFGPEKQLPLSGVPVSKVSGNENTMPGTIVDNLQKSSIEFKARSAFMATSGHGDTFVNQKDLVGSLRQGLYLDESLFPTLDFEVDSPLNAYIVDLYNHQQRNALIKYNKIREDTLFEQVKEFVNILKVIRTALEKRAQDDDAKLLASIFNELAVNFEEIFKNKFKVLK